MPEITVEEPQIQRINTSCKSCFFSVWQDNTQTGCTIRLIDKFKELGNVIEVFDEVGDEFYVVNGRHCQFKRSVVWGHHFGKNHDLAYQQARKEIFPKVELIVYLDKLDKDTFKLLDKTLESVDKTKVSLLKIVNNSLQDPAPLSEHLQQTLMRLEMNDIKRISKHVIEDATFDRCADLAIKESKNPYFLMCKVGFKFPKKALAKIDVILNDDLSPISLVTFKSGAYMGQTMLYKMVGGNVDRPFVDKIKDAAKEQEKEALVMEMKDE